MENGKDFYEKQRQAFEDFKTRYGLKKKKAPHFSLFPEDSRHFFGAYMKRSIVLIEKREFSTAMSKITAYGVVLRDGSCVAITQDEYNELTKTNVLNNAANHIFSN